MSAQASLPTTLVVDRTLARVAAARRIESATEAEQLKLALDYGLLTARTNLLVVHERAEGEKAQDLPELAKVAQMHAAGWHGVGSVHESRARHVNACMLDASARRQLRRIGTAGRRARRTSFRCAEAVSRTTT